MTNEEAIEVLAQDLPCETDEDLSEAMTMAIKALEQQPCEDAISRKDMLAVFSQSHSLTQAWDGFEKLPSVTPKEKTGHCKDCKHFEYDHIENVSGIPLIVAHEICSRWGDGCKTKEDGYCFLFESQESEDKK